MSVSVVAASHWPGVSHGSVDELFAAAHESSDDDVVDDDFDDGDVHEELLQIMNPQTQNRILFQLQTDQSQSQSLRRIHQSHHRRRHQTGHQSQSDDLHDGTDFHYDDGLDYEL